MSRRRAFLTYAFVALVAGGLGFVVRGAAAGDEAPAGEMEKPIDQHALVKSLVGTWTTKGTSVIGAMAGTATHGLECGNTILLTRTSGKAGAIAFHGLGVLKFSADGKTATQWWFDSGMDTALVMTGPVTADGYTIEGSNKLGSSKTTLTKKGDGFELKIWADGAEFMTETQTKVK